MYFKNALIFFLISFIMISPKVNSQEINSVGMQELILDIIDPNKSMFQNIENLEKTQFKCNKEQGRKVSCATTDGKITLSRRGRSTTEVIIPPIFFDIYPEDDMSLLLDSVIDVIGEIDYEMKSISGIVFIFNLSDRSFVLSLAGLVFKTLNN
jgi:hypothetical protein